MVLRSLLALHAGDDWLEGNLVALGASHAEYGVTYDMYDSFASVLVDCARDVLGATFDDALAGALDAGIREIGRCMADAGEARLGERP